MIDKQKETMMATLSMMLRERAVVAAAPDGASSVSMSTFTNNNNHTTMLGDEPSEMRRMIVGGTVAAAGQYPWFAVLIDEDGDDYCGATLIHPRVLLTAAHCVEDVDFAKKRKKGRPLGVIIGDVQRDPDKVQEPAKYRTIVDRLLHPEFDDEESNNFDFALLKLNLPVNTIAPIALNTNASRPADDETLTIMGFGMTREVFGNSPTKLRHVNISVISNDLCRARYFIKRDEIQDETMFCAGEWLGGKDSCNGDSGGPTITATGVQVGVTR
jgi:trypsin